MSVKNVFSKKKVIVIISVLAVAAISLLLALVEKKQSSKICDKIEITIDAEAGNHFISEADILDLLTLGGSESIIGKMKAELDLKKIENRLVKNPFIQEAEVYSMHSGKLKVKVKQTNPLARIIFPNGQQNYLDENGNLLPLSKRYTTRVPIIFSRISKENLSTEENKNTHLKDFLQLLIFIKNNKFWNAQIAEIELKRNYTINMFPQITRQQIEFGTPQNFEEKLRMLHIFYKQILPNKGWNTYTKVSVKYHNQIICS